MKKFVVMFLFAFVSYLFPQSTNQLWTTSVTDIEDPVLMDIVLGSNSIFITGMTYQFPSNAFWITFNYNGGKINETKFVDNYYNYSDSWSACKGLGNSYYSSGAVGVESDSGIITYPWVIELSEDADTLWSKSFDLDSEIKRNRLRTANNVICTSDSCLVLAYNCTDLALESLSKLIKLDSSGNVIWIKEIQDIYPRLLIETADKGFIFVGRHSGSGDGVGIYKLNSLGEQIWYNNFTHRENDSMESVNAGDVIELPDGSYIISAGISDSRQYQVGRAVVLRYSSDGDMVIKNIIPDEIKDHTTLMPSIVSKNSTEFYWFDTKVDNSLRLFLIDIDGNIKWQKNYVSDFELQAKDIEIMDDGNLIIAYEEKDEESNTRNAIIAKIDSLGNTNGLSIINSCETSTLPNQFELMNNFPNPFNPTTNIQFSVPEKMNVRISVYNIQGRQITELTNKEYIAGQYELKFDGSGLASGVYFYRIETDSYINTKKMLLLK